MPPFDREDRAAQTPIHTQPKKKPKRPPRRKPPAAPKKAPSTALRKTGTGPSSLKKKPTYTTGYVAPLPPPKDRSRAKRKPPRVRTPDIVRPAERGLIAETIRHGQAAREGERIRKEGRDFKFGDVWSAVKAAPERAVTGIANDIEFLDKYGSVRDIPGSLETGVTFASEFLFPESNKAIRQGIQKRGWKALADPRELDNLTPALVEDILDQTVGKAATNMLLHGDTSHKGTAMLEIATVLPFLRAPRAAAEFARQLGRGRSVGQAAVAARDTYRESRPVIEAVKFGKDKGAKVLHGPKKRILKLNDMKITTEPAKGRAGRGLIRGVDAARTEASIAREAGDAVYRRLLTRYRTLIASVPRLRKALTKLDDGESYALHLIADQTPPTVRAEYHARALQNPDISEADRVNHSFHLLLAEEAARHVRVDANGAVHLADDAGKWLREAEGLVRTTGAEREEILNALKLLTPETIKNRAYSMGRIYRGAIFQENEVALRHAIETHPNRMAFEDAITTQLEDLGMKPDQVDKRVKAVMKLFDASIRAQFDHLNPVEQQAAIMRFLSRIDQPELYGEEYLKAAEVYGVGPGQGELGDAPNEILFQELRDGPDPETVKHYTNAARRLLRAHGDSLPEGHETATKLRNLLLELRQRAVEAEAYRRWYKQSADAILAEVGYDTVEATKLAKLFAIYSPRAKVWDETRWNNTTRALGAYREFRETGRISDEWSLSKNSPRDWQTEAAMNAMTDGPDWEGIKTNSFFSNFLKHIDRQAHDAMFGPEGRVTIDVWMTRVFKYLKGKGKDPQLELDGVTGRALADAPKNDAEYAFMSDAIRVIAEEMGWNPEEAQAAIWTSIKAEMEGTPLSDAGLDFKMAIDKANARFDAEVYADTGEDVGQLGLDIEGVGTVKPGERIAPEKPETEATYENLLRDMARRASRSKITTEGAMQRAIDDLAKHFERFPESEGADKFWRVYERARPYREDAAIPFHRADFRAKPPHERIALLTEKNGGGTFKIADDGTIGESPDSGFVVATSSKHNVQVPKDEFDGSDIAAFATEKADELSKPGHYLGTWLDEETGIVHLDVVEVFDNKLTARNATRDRGELAFYDLAAGEEIRVEPPAKGTLAAWEQEQRSVDRLREDLQGLPETAEPNLAGGPEDVLRDLEAQAQHAMTPGPEELLSQLDEAELAREGLSPDDIEEVKDILREAKEAGFDPNDPVWIEGGRRLAAAADSIDAAYAEGVLPAQAAEDMHRAIGEGDYNDALEIAKHFLDQGKALEYPEHSMYALEALVDDLFDLNVHVDEVTSMGRGPHGAETQSGRAILDEGVGYSDMDTFEAALPADATSLSTADIEALSQEDFDALRLNYVFHGTDVAASEKILAEGRLRAGYSGRATGEGKAWVTDNPRLAARYADARAYDVHGPAAPGAEPARGRVVLIPKTAVRGPRIEKIDPIFGAENRFYGGTVYTSPDDILFDRFSDWMSRTILGAAEFGEGPMGTTFKLHLAGAAEVPTIVHELAHMIRRMLMTESQSNRIARAMGAIWDTEQHRYHWTVAAEEKFAKTMMQVIRTRRGPQSVKAAFKTIAKDLRKDYYWHDLPDVPPHVADVIEDLFKFGKLKGGRLVGAEDFIGNSNFAPFYLGYKRGVPVPPNQSLAARAAGSYARAVNEIGALFSGGRGRAIGRGKMDPKVKHQLKGYLIEHGLVTASADAAVEDAIVAARMQVAHEARTEFLLPASTELPTSLDDIPIVVNPGAHTESEQMRRIYDALDALGRDGKLDAEQVERVEEATIHAISNDLFPTEIDGREVALVVRDALETQTPVENIRWLSRDFVDRTGLLHKPRTSMGDRIPPGNARRVWNGTAWTYDTVATVAKALLTVFNPAYPLMNLSGTVMMNLFHQGIYAPVNLWKAVQMSYKMSARNRVLVDSIMGTGFAENIGFAPSKFATNVVQKFAHWEGMVIDMIPRRAAFLHEARKAGYDGEALDALLSNSRDPNAARVLDSIRERAVRKIGDFESMKPWERDTMARLILFYPWFRTATNYTVHLAIDQPILTGALVMAYDYAQAAADEQLGERPQYASQTYPVGGSSFGFKIPGTDLKLGLEDIGLGGTWTDPNGLPMTLSIRQAFPTTTPVDLMNAIHDILTGEDRESLINWLNPVPAAAIQASVGKEVFYNRDIPKGPLSFVKLLFAGKPAEKEIRDLIDEVTLTDEELTKENEKKVYPRRGLPKVLRVGFGSLAAQPYNPDRGQAAAAFDREDGSGKAVVLRNDMKNLGLGEPSEQALEQAKHYAILYGFDGDEVDKAKKAIDYYTKVTGDDSLKKEVEQYGLDEAAAGVYLKFIRDQLTYEYKALQRMIDQTKELSGE